MDEIFIPHKIRVGYNLRKDTYSGKLGYVIYYDEKGKIRKEPSFNNWIDKKEGVDEFDNDLLEGFVLNKKTGDYSDWYHRQAYVRVYDPRGFEIEIGINNLLYILENCNCIKGKGLEGKFCYGYIGGDLVLLPEDSESYKKSKRYSDLLFNPIKVKSSELKVGNIYKLKNRDEVVYLGRYNNSFERFGWSNQYPEYVNKNLHFYVELDDFNNWKNVKYKHWEIKSTSSFSALEKIGEVEDLSEVMVTFNDIISYTGTAKVYYNIKELQDMITNEVKSFSVMISDGKYKEFVVCNWKKDFIEVTYNGCENWNYHREYDCVLDKDFGFSPYYIGEFVNGKLIKKSCEIILKKK